MRLKAGRGPGLNCVVDPVAPVTVFVGPNNAGKSRVLTEIEQWCRTGRAAGSEALLDKVVFSGLSVEEAAETISSLLPAEYAGEVPSSGTIILNHRPLQVGNLNRVLQLPESDPHAFCREFLSSRTLKLDAHSRVALVNPQSAGDLLRPPTSSLQVLLRDEARRMEVRRIVFDAFGEHFVVDPTNLGSLRIRLSSSAPATEIEEVGIHSDARQFHERASLIESASDGVKAFVGIITQLVAGDPRIMLIDEPEAFLHPALAQKLGYEIARAAARSQKRVFVSTHSAAFLMGCIHSGTPVTVVRLTFRDRTATARLLGSDELLTLMRNPLLRSTGVLSGLFAESVVVTESDADRAFYQEVNERLLRFKPEFAIPGCLFLNAQNKQTVHVIVDPLRRLGIPTAGVVDVDALKEGGVVWTNLLSAAGIPEIARNSLAVLRSDINGAFKRTGMDMKRAGGVEILGAAEKETAELLLAQLREYGVFIVPGGELESWLKNLGVTGHTPAWLISVFEKMGSDPDSPGFVKPTDGDVWSFVGGMRRWFVNSARKGIPM